MKTITAKDGTRIAFDQSGKGPVAILVGGALQYRAFDQGKNNQERTTNPDFRFPVRRAITLAQ